MRAGEDISHSGSADDASGAWHASAIGDQSYASSASCFSSPAKMTLTGFLQGFGIIAVVCVVGVLVPIFLSACSAPTTSSGVAEICDKYAAVDYSGRPTAMDQYRTMFVQCLKERGL